MFSLLLLSLVGLLIVSIRHTRESHNFRLLTVHVGVLCTFSLLFWLFFQRLGVITASSESHGNEAFLMIILYVFMFLGMFAHAGYKRFIQPQTPKLRFDLGLFLAPIFASSLVFIPLLASLRNDASFLDGMTTMKMMVFFVTFENGFFWKEYFDNRKMEKATASI